MNLFGFGKKTPAAAPKHASPQEAITLLDSRIETLEKRDKFLNTKAEICKKDAFTKNKKGDKSGALIALKKAHRYADEQKKMQATILNLENQKMSIESAAFNVEIMQTYETSSKTLKNIHKDIDTDKVDDIMEEMEEQHDISNQISEALTRNADDIFEDEDLLAQLDDLAEEMEELEEMERAPVVPTKAQQTATATSTTATTTTPDVVFNFPTAPQGQIQQQAVKETEDERAIRELQESMLA